MKKYTLISTLISAAALAVPAFADDSLLPSGISSATRLYYTDSLPSGWSQDIGHPSNITADVVNSCYNVEGWFNGTGWYWGMGNGQNANDGDFSSTDDTGFSFDGRARYNGAYVAALVELSDILDEGEELSSFSLSFEYSGSSVGFSVYCIDLSGDTTSTTQLYTTTSTGSISYTWTADSADEYLTGDYALMFIWNSDAGGNEADVINLTSSYTVTTLPEPSMFGLMFGLGAIGLVATRRRRRA